MGPVAGTMAQQGGGTTMAPPSAGTPNALERLLPTLGGVLGGIGGDLVAPVAGGVGGAAAGDAFGKFLENKFTGQGGGNGLLGAAVTGGVGQGVGEGLGLAAKGAGGLLSRFGAGAASKATDAATQAAEEQATKDSIQSGIDKVTATHLNYGVLPDKAASQLKLGTNQGFVDSMGHDSTNPYEMRTVANAGYDLNNTVDNALQNVNIDTSGAANPAYKLAQEGKLATPEASSLMNAYSKANIPLGPDGSIPTTLPATSVRQLTQSLGSEMGDKDVQIAQTEHNGFDATTLKNQRAQLQTVRDDLVKRLSTNPEVNANIESATVSPEDQLAMSQKYGEPLSNHISGIINGAKSYSDIVPEMQRFAQMGKASDKAIDDIENISNSDRAVAREKLAGKANMPVPSTPPQTTLPEAGAHAANAVGHVINGNKGQAMASMLKAGRAVSGPVASGMGSVLGRISKFVPPVTTAAANTLTAGADPTQGGAMPPQPGQPGAQMGNTPTASPEALQMMLGLIGMQADPYMSSTFAPMITGAVKPMQQAQTAGTALQSLEGQYNNAGGGQGGINGLLSRLAAVLPGSAGNQYNRQAAQLQQTLQGLGVPGSVQPSIMSSPQTSQAQFSTLQNIINSLGGQQGASVLSGIPASQ